MPGIVRPAKKEFVTPDTGRVTLEFDAFLGLLTDAVNAVSQGGLVAPKAYTVATLPSVTANVGRMVYVSDAAGGGIPAFSDGTFWLRVDTRAVVI